MIEDERIPLVGLLEEEVAQANSAGFGRLHILDEIFNALHGVGDLDEETKRFIISLVKDIGNGGEVVAQACSDQQDRDNIVAVIHVIDSALRNRPIIARAVLDRWIQETKLLFAK